MELEWPEYKNLVLILTRPTYQIDAEIAPTTWKQRYLEEAIGIITIKETTPHPLARWTKKKVSTVSALSKFEKCQ